MKIIRSAIAILSITFLLIDCSKHESTPSKEELLTGNSSKSWNISFSSFDATETDESCKAVNSYNADNSWIFKTKGNFEFNSGTLHEIPNCTDCNCSEFVNFVGTWSLSTLDTLVVVANGRIETNGQITAFDDEEILRYKIKSITATEMNVSVPPGGYVTFKAK